MLLISSYVIIKRLKTFYTRCDDMSKKMNKYAGDQPFDVSVFVSVTNYSGDLSE